MSNMFTSRNYRLLAILFVSLAAFFGPINLMAQDTAAAAETAAVSNDMSLLELFRLGGWAMYPLLLLSIAAVGLILYNGIALREKTFLDPDTTDSVKDALSNLQIEEAKTICTENPGAVTNIIYAGLRRIEPDEFDPAAVEKAMEEASVDELAAPMTLINYLNTVAGVSPMVGLLGTVSGMIKAFGNIAAQGMGRPELLADNISEALITTASGLIVAIPALIFYFLYKNKYGKIASKVSRITGDSYYALVHAVKRQSR